MIKEEYYIIEFNGEKEQNEMDALELQTIEQAIEWIEGAMESDAMYFNINIDCDIGIIKNKRYDNEKYCQALAHIKYDHIVTDDMMDSDIYAPDIIIRSNLSIVSKIVKILSSNLINK